jgi:hypothetical protein
MPRVHYVKKAAKDNPAVKKGEPYYWWKFRYGGKRYSAIRPRESQLTQSKWSEALSAMEACEDAASLDDLESACQDAAGTCRELADEYREAAEHFGGEGENAERADHAEALADELESVTFPDPEEDESEEDHLAACIEQVTELDWYLPC